MTHAADLYATMARCTGLDLGVIEQFGAKLQHAGLLPPADDEIRARDCASLLVGLMASFTPDWAPAALHVISRCAFTRFSTVLPQGDKDQRWAVAPELRKLFVRPSFTDVIAALIDNQRPAVEKLEHHPAVHSISVHWQAAGPGAEVMLMMQTPGVERIIAAHYGADEITGEAARLQRSGSTGGTIIDELARMLGRVTGVSARQPGEAASATLH